MSIITHHTTLPDSSEKTDFYSLIDNATATGIVDSDIASTAAIADSKLASITTAGKVDGSSLTNLSNTPSGAGALPVANINLTTSTAIGTTSPAAGKFTTLEATTTLKLGTTNQGDIIYDNGTSLVRLTPGTSGQLLKTQGAAANPLWGYSGVTLISNTSFSSASSSGSITVAKNKYYLAKFTITGFSGAMTINMRCNGDSGAHYNYAYIGRNSGGSTLTGNAAGASSIIMTGSVDASHTVSGEIWLSQGGSSQIPVIHGQVSYIGTGLELINFSGYWDNSADITSFEVLPSTGTITGLVLLYEYSQS